MSLSVGMAGVIFTQTGLPNVQIAYRINPTPRVTLITAVSSAVCPSSRAKLAAFVDIAWSRFTGSRCIISYIFHCLRLTLTFQLWSGSAFQPTTLKDMGLRIQLNHLSNRCSTPHPCHRDFRVLHTNGVHEINLDFCGCEREVPRYIQLLRRQLFPATQLNPRTCATFGLLTQFHLLTLTSKVSAYDYYRALERLTDNTGVNLPKSRYRALIRMGLQWRHLKLLKRAGRGNDPSGVLGTKPGELAILCPTCPHPGINLPDDWKSRPATEQCVRFSPHLTFRSSFLFRFLYTLVVCMDANFRLKNQLVSNYSVDPGLGIGLAYMVDRKPYEKYVLSRANDDDVGNSLQFFRRESDASNRSKVV